MLVIRPEQMAVFERNAEVLFRDKLKRHLAWFLAQRGIEIEADPLGEQVARGMTQCVAFGLDRECDIARFFEIVCGSVGGFTAQPLPKEAQNILYAYRVDPAMKLARLQAWAEKRSEGRQ